MNPSALTPLQQRFCDEYLIDFNGRAAAIRAGYAPKHAKSQASDLLKLPQVEQYFAEKQAARSEAQQIEMAELLQHYANIAFFNIQTLFDENGRLIPIDELPPGAAAAIAKIEVHRTLDTGGMGKNGSRVVKVVPFKKMAALNALARHFRLFDAKYQQSLRDKDKHIYIDWDPVERRCVTREVSESERPELRTTASTEEGK